ncbi:SDR family NAD(P)-dependent oxidoreductase [Aquirhabdus parva]|uniref:SDR family NAD(P)-dependent oxidoreductase n=1 Tax=Aquirhabdus parva TaxID=2283318 RepID=A0A345P7Q1_9GAMM|nr:SDR family NAD(P)-dependent oxidoreductase [Aquirhabdus parva]AXI03310.1 SDR family NAD(P)-dependent oxidoreductase [Aquirhabdus parva]
MKTFKNKVAAITGAGSGMGQQLAVLLAKAGCNVAISDINKTGLEQTVELLKPYKVKVTVDVVNTAKQDAVYAWADKVKKEHGKVNLIFNNAGIAMSNTVEGHSIDDYERMMAVNFWGVVYGTKAFLPYLKESGDGHIINTSSIFGLTAQPTQSAYNASKFAVRGFTESLRQELDMGKFGVSATCVHPGGIKTNIAHTAEMSENVASLGINTQKSKAMADKVMRIPASKAAQIILDGVKADKRRVLIGPEAYAVDGLQRLFPTAYQRLFTLGSKFSI